MTRYLRHRARYRRPAAADSAILKRLFAQLVHDGIIRTKTPPTTVTPNQRILNEYETYLHTERGLTLQTTCKYLPVVKLFLASRRGPLSQLCIQDVVKFVRHQAMLLKGKVRVHRTTTALRSFLRYTRYCGYTVNDLAAGVPKIASWSLTTIPRSISQDDLRKVLASCDRESAVGRRDFAILLLLARLGIRAGEVVALTLDDIDWRAGCLYIRGKTGDRSQLPLPADVGAAIADYLKRRPRTNDSRALFTCVIAPIRGLQNSISICSIVNRALTRAGIRTSRRGAHQFRHALATEMLRKGTSLPEIGQILRHRSPRTTAIYAKADLTALRSLALPWPRDEP